MEVVRITNSNSSFTFTLQNIPTYSFPFKINPFEVGSHDMQCILQQSRLWQYRLWSFQTGLKNQKVFCLRINILQGNYSTSRIGLVGPSEVFKCRVLEINYFHPPIHLCNYLMNYEIFGNISMRKMICISDNMI